MLAATGTEFTETFLKDKAHLTTLRSDGDLMFMQVPMLKIDGLKLVQSMAICRHLARKHGMDGKTLEDKARVDMINEGARDFLTKFFPIGFAPNTEAIKEDIKNKHFVRFLPIFEKLLAENASGYLVGDGLTIADVTLFEALLNAEDNFPGCLDKSPKVKAFKAKIGSLPRIKAYLEGPQRKSPPTPEYVKHAMSVLS